MEDPVVAVWSQSPVPLFVTPQSIALQAPLSMGFPRQEYKGGLPFHILVLAIDCMFVVPEILMMKSNP